MSVVVTLVDPRMRLAREADRIAYEMTAIAAAHFSRYGFAYEELPTLRDAFIAALDRR